MNHSKKSLLALLLAAIMLLSVLAGCGQKDGAPAENTSQSDTAVEETSTGPAAPAESTETEAGTTANGHVANVKVGMVKGFEGFNMLKYNGTMAFMNYNNFVMSQLVAKDENGNLIPSMFRTWEISDDNKVLTVTIPTNAKWHDGIPVTAEDVKFSLEYQRDVMLYGNLAALTDVTIKSEDTLVLTFSKPTAYGFLYDLFTMSTYVIPKHVWEGVEDPEQYQGEDASIGCGPYKFVSFDEAAQTAHFEAVDDEDYFMGEITVDSVDIVAFENQEAMIMAMINGDIDCMYNYSVSVDPSLLPMLQNAENIDLGAGPYPGNEFMSFGQQCKVNQDVAFRNAVSYAINYPVTVSAIGGEYGEVPRRGIIPPGNKGFDASIEKLEYNPEMAMKLLDEAGYADVDGDGFREDPDGEPIDLCITPYVGKSTMALRTRLAEVVMESLKSVGIMSHLDEEAIANSDLSYKRTFEDKDYDLYLGGVTQGIAMFNTAANYFVDAGDMGGGTYADPEYAETFRSLFQVNNDEDYVAAVQKLQQIHAEDVPAVALCWQQGLFPYRTDKFEGGVYYPGWGIVNNQMWYTLTSK